MSTATKGQYELVTWDYDCAPDGCGYYVSDRFTGSSVEKVELLCSRYSRVRIGSAIFQLRDGDASFVKGEGLHETDYPPLRGL